MTSHRAYNPGQPMPLASDSAAVAHAKLKSGDPNDTEDTDAVVTATPGQKQTSLSTGWRPFVTIHFWTFAEAQAFADFIEKTSAIWASQNPRNVVTFPHGRPGFACINHPPKTEF